jgi:hypothetical protein
MSSHKINIFGSCVSRDSVEFARGLTVGLYAARQSVVSAVAAPVARATLDALTFSDGTHEFHRRCVLDDFRKTTLNQIEAFPPDEILVVDFIEERVALGVTAPGTFVTYSQAASSFSNARSLLTRLIEPYSDDHVALFADSIGDFARRLQGRPVVLHRAFYAEGPSWDHAHANRVLGEFYDRFQACIDPVAVIEMPRELRVFSPVHKWGPAPYHYIDDYYRHFVAQWAAALDPSVSLKESFTLQKAAA